MNNTTFEIEYQKLNNAQKKAVDDIYGQIMVVAWPWTWKTQIIWLRTANIILKTWVNPNNILITTFTDAWVISIKKRLIKFLWNEWHKVNVSTIHSLSQEIIKTFPEKFIEYKAWTPIDDVEQLEIIKIIIDKLIEEKKIEKLTTEYDKYFYLREIKGKISNLKQEWINIPKLKNSIKKQEELYSEELSQIKQTLKKYETTKEKNENHIVKLNELVILYDEYNNYLRNNSLYDFNDMINFVLQKLKEDEELKYHYAEKFQFIMLDEYQDTNDAQNWIINEILSVNEDEPNIMVVWDDDQSIYRFQWANIENMLDFSTKYKNTKFIVLENNYRSNQYILDLSTKLIKNNNERLSNKIKSIEKKLISSSNLKNSKIKPILIKAGNDIYEKTFIINEIKKITSRTTNLAKLEGSKNKIELNNIAIIVRNNREVEEWTQVLQQNNIETESKLKTNILKNNYVKIILDYLKLIENPYSDEISLINLMRTEIIWLNWVDVIKINRELYILNYSKKQKIKLIDFLTNENYLNELNFIDKKSLINFKDNLIDFWKKNSELSLVEFFSFFIEKTKILEHIEKNWNFDDLQDIYTLFNKIKEWNNRNKNLNIIKLLEKIELYNTYNYPIPRQILIENKLWVNIMTAHGSKWLEFNTVFVPWLYTWNWDTKTTRNLIKLPIWIIWEWLQKSDFNQIEEDRRLLFVAITRTEENLFLSYPAWIWTKPLIESIFIDEINWEFNEIIYPGNITSSQNPSHAEYGGIVEIIKNNLENNLIKYSSLEFDYIKTFLETYKISPSDLNAFIEDPLIFLNRVIFKYPFVDNKYTIFGKVYHRTLELFYLKYKKEWKIPEKDYLVATFKLLLEKEILIPEENKTLLENWVLWLEWYYDLYSKNIDEPLELEYSFRSKNIIFESIPLTWIIDKIEKNWTISNFSQWKESNNKWQMAFFKENVVLIDYKTWNTKTLWQVKWTDRFWNKKDWEWKYFRQLMFYKLLCEMDKEFNSKYEVWNLAIDFVEWKNWKYKFLEVDYTSEEYEEFKNELKDAWEKISDIDFWKKLLSK